MKNEIETSDVVKEIWDLHVRFLESLKKSLEYGIRIGELLAGQKAALPHGQFGKWIDENMPFSTRTAQNYMKIFRERERLKNASVSHLTAAYSILTDPKPLTGGQAIAHCYADCVNRVKESGCSWQDAFNLIVVESGFHLNALLTWHQNFFGVVDDTLLPDPWTEQDTEHVVNNIQRIYEDRKNGHTSL